MADTYYTDRLLHGDCIAKLKGLADASIDSIVTDPPYELSFMSRQWDSTGIAYQVELWAECMRVLKSGGHLLAFGGTRTYHRMTVAIEDAGFEIRDSIHWTYGSGFPKSLDVSKAIDKQRDDRADIYKVTAWVKAARDAAGKTNKDIDAAFGLNGMAGHWTSGKSQPAVPTIDQVPQLLEVLDVGVDDVPTGIRQLLWDLNGRKGQPGENWAKREVVGERDVPVGHSFAGSVYGGDSSSRTVDVTAPATDAARTWYGWGTALKPSHEPIVVARKPLSGTVASNVLTHGTGALNIDGCRVGTGTGEKRTVELPDIRGGKMHAAAERGTVTREVVDNGRWPANTILTHAADCDGQCEPGCPVQALDQQADASRFFTQADWDDEWDGPQVLYVAKPSKSERNAGGDNKHPTVKPVALMRHLCRLTTPPGGTVLDPFLGSGTTAVAAILEGFDWKGCEMTDEYLPIIKGRIQHARETVKKDAEAAAAAEPTLFGGDTE